MEFGTILDLISNQGVVVAAFCWLMWQNAKQQDKLMDFTKEIATLQGEMNSQLFMIREDLADIRRKTGNNKEYDK